jgi:hypothetical protein
MTPRFFVILAAVLADAAMASTNREKRFQLGATSFFDLLADLYDYPGSFLDAVCPKKEAR